MTGVRGLDVGGWCGLDGHNQTLMVQPWGRSGILLQRLSYSSVSGHEAGQHQDTKTIPHLPLALSNRAPLLEPFRLATAVRLGRLPSSYWSGLHPPPLVPLPAPWRRQTVCWELSLPINYHTGTVYQSTYRTTLPAAVSPQNPVQVGTVQSA